ncbi:MAG: type I polyketide synthase, partial [Deltaproteobacteria bacterium]|nr:type I polyketide synthase [Deltaproteobacteria bacterium]
WVSGVIDCPEEEAKKVLKGKGKVYLLIVNTLNECVLGGNRSAVEEVVKTLGCRFFPLSGVPTVHCEVARIEERPYHELHLFETSPPPDITFYSCALESAYEVTRKNAADSILAQVVNSINFPRLIDAAYEDGIRIFLEMGPGSSCTRMIGNILDSRPHMALSACAPGQDDAASVLRLLGRLLSERVPVDLNSLYGGEASATEYRTSQPPASITIPIGGKAFQVPAPEHRDTLDIEHNGFRVSQSKIPPGHRPIRAGGQNPKSKMGLAQSMEPMLRQAEAAETAGMQAHEEYLRLSKNISQTLSDNLAFQMTLVEAMRSLPESGTTKKDKRTVAFDRPMCLEFAIGSIAGMLGPDFAPIDSHPTRVRLPDEPLMLVDRIVSVEGKPRSLTNGRVITEHDILPGAWYLDHGRIPTCIAVEAGQADLFLSGYLGIDFKTKGLAVYRLLDAAVTFHRELPGPGTVIRYNIRIERFFRQGETHLFRFNFEGTVNGEPLLTMTDGCAGFFTLEELVAGQGIVHTELDLRPLPGIRPDDWQDFVPMDVASYSKHQINTLRSGDLAGCFGPSFEDLGLTNPLRIPGGRMALVDRVVHLDPGGGRFGLGIIRAVADIHADDWFLTCHFIDDPVMPGTLMYECCLHTLRIFLLRMGWVGEQDTVVCGPVPGVAGRLKCRGQVIETTQKVTYEISIKELGYRPEPYAIVDALMYADDKLIVEINDMSIRFSGLTEQKITDIWHSKKRSGSKDSTSEIQNPEVLFDHDRILAFAVGKPSEAFGETYRVFNSERSIARLPGPPYQFLDYITGIDAEQWQMKPGGTVETQYHVPANAWYFSACGMPELPEMPFAVLMEIALQPCGWLAAYMGSALTSDSDLSFRNLGGTAVQYEPVFPHAGTLTTSVKVTNVSTSAGMIIQNYDFEVRNEGRPVYTGDTYFGFFTKQALADQVGIRDAAPYEPTPGEIGKGLKFDYPEGLLFPDAQLRMVDRIELFVPDGGPNGLGFIRGTKGIDPREWFFKAHFFEDPVWPGSLGLESFLQAIKVVAVNRWGIGVWAESTDIQLAGPGIKNFTMAPGERHSWLYRGQILPSDNLVTVQASVTSIDDVNRRIRADGFLMVDGRVIYQINDFEIMAT